MKRKWLTENDIAINGLISKQNIAAEGKFKEAIALSELLIENAENLVDRQHAVCLLGKVLAESSDIQRARETIRSAIKRDSDLIPNLTLTRF